MARNEYGCTYEFIVGEAFCHTAFGECVLFHRCYLFVETKRGKETTHRAPTDWLTPQMSGSCTRTQVSYTASRKHIIWTIIPTSAGVCSNSSKLESELGMEPRYPTAGTQLLDPAPAACRGGSALTEVEICTWLSNPGSLTWDPGNLPTRLKSIPCDLVVS